MAISLTVMTYNVHSCIGTDGLMSPSRIAAVIAACNADVIALQELDAGLKRSAGTRQAEEVARYLDMEFHFHPSFQVESGMYGNAILSRYPLRLVQAGALPSGPGGERLEPRGVLWAEVSLPGIKLQMLNTHLGLRRRERQAQVNLLLGSCWLDHPACRPPIVLCGDLNSLPGYSAHRHLRSRLRDVQRTFTGGGRKTWPSRYPLLCLDYVLVSADIVPRTVSIPRSPLARVASDHLPVVAELVIAP